MNKKIISILLMLSIALTLQSAYKTNQYMKVVDVKGRVKISSQKAIVKPARNGDLLFTKDNISTENNSSLTSYLESNNIFKVKENSSLNIDESYDKTGNTKLTLDNGDFLIAASSNAKADSITVLTSNASIKVSGAAAISYTNGNTKAQFLYGEGEVNGTKIAQFTEVNIDNSNKLSIKDIEPNNEEFANNIIEVTSMPYVETIIPEASNMSDVKNYYEKYNDKTVSENNTEAASIDYVGNTNENRTTLIITNETK
ncbi:FecR domain-containing protein [Brachyspira innocens]|uniref:FecR domain-containing protein n=1 Tax=Brachyspira innocens TaxID=13264 RepID=A0ABT8YYX9_9SPIR|nr:FecR domain-containing protein [Brachyspira innocens]MDO6994643.1 FecR domain-containing protein [Brachyspira innocens]MDO7021097.1 FecR domain-containing protein [Brachyspira innocens]